ncbi:MAG: RdgB/HAM1 family non-canonical purine NTP pyrophosphatase [Erysipelotrichaceae bacterium]|nr:RdgB/HAM1 family non-canonical purine NTP pyrophosphatase [Erysipelotrichaceae bacterium]
MELFVVTSNQHKIDEFKELLEPLGYKIKSLLDLKENIEIIEDGKTFEENAIIKAKTICERFNITCIADDSGLEIDALNKEPGVLSARYLGHDTSYEYKNNVILERMKDKKDRTCRFVCVIALVSKNEIKTFRGEVEGKVAYKIKGSNGFGYDPIFFYEPFNDTLANVSSSMKNSISHRGNAIRKMVEYFENNK